MKGQVKLSAEERRRAIIRSVRRVFAERGFDGTTTRALADAAGVSEALLFKHFPNKEALFLAMQDFCCETHDPELLDRLKALAPSTMALVVIVHMMVADTLAITDKRDEDSHIHNRLMLRSVMEDGDFARLFLERTTPCWIAKVEDCLRASVAAGEAECGPVAPYQGALLAKNMARAVMLCQMPVIPVIDYKIPREKLVEQAVWFILRGLGVREDAITRYYNTETIAQFLS